MVVPNSANHGTTGRPVAASKNMVTGHDARPYDDAVGFKPGVGAAAVSTILDRSGPIVAVALRATLSPAESSTMMVGYPQSAGSAPAPGSAVTQTFRATEPPRPPVVLADAAGVRPSPSVRLLWLPLASVLASGISPVFTVMWYVVLFSVSWEIEKSLD